MPTTPSPGARLLCIGFDGPAVNDHLKRVLDRGVGGVILFTRNLAAVDQIAELVAGLKAYAGRPVYVAIDHEGGRVCRLPEPFTRVPAMRELGATGDADLARAVGGVLGTELRACGIDVNFAPVMDVDTNPANPVIGERSLSSDPAAVARLGAAVIEGMQSASVAACAKHFPGHGDTDVDSHLDLPRLPHDMNRLQRVELPPFRAAIDAGVASVMSAHILFPALDPDVPGTMSPAVMTGLLREQLGFQGVIFSDDLEMKAVADHFGVPNAAVAAVRAGVDVLLVCHREDVQMQALDALNAAMDQGRISEQRIDESIMRIDHMLERVQCSGQSTPIDVIGCEAHRAIVDRL